MELIDGGLRGWKTGDFFCARDGSHMGAVLSVQDWGLLVLWDDRQVGHLLWDGSAPNNIDTVKQLTLHGHHTLRDFYDVPLDDLWRAVGQRVYPESFPRGRSSRLSTRDYLHAL